MESVFYWYLLPSAFLLDLILGDPRWLPHPIRWMGMWIEGWEPFFRRLPFGLTVSGCLFAFLLVTGTWTMAELLLTLAQRIHPVIQAVLQVIILYYCISVRSLQEAAMDVYWGLKSGDIRKARKKLSYIVGRDVRSLDAQGIMRGAIETVAENLVDGVVSPLFFAALGGAPLALAYKMVNTLDSMIGYRNEKYRHFGKCAARLDDLCNFVPARISIFVIWLGACMTGRNGKESLETGVTEGSKHHSPNAGWPEAAFAGALGIRLGGPNYYGGQLVDKPFIGARLGEASPEDVKTACDLMVLSAMICMLTCWGSVVLVGVL